MTRTKTSNALQGNFVSMYLRDYRTDDLSALYALDRICFEPPFRFSRDAMRQFAEARNAFVQLACVRRSEVTDAARQEHLLGFVIVHLEKIVHGSTGYVVTLDVVPASRRQGIAEKLMRSVEGAALEAGMEEMALHVFGPNTAAIRLYKRLGYMHAGTAEHFYGRQLHALIYRKPLRRGPPESGPEQGSNQDEVDSSEEERGIHLPKRRNAS